MFPDDELLVKLVNIDGGIPGLDRVNNGLIISIETFEDIGDKVVIVNRFSERSEEVRGRSDRLNVFSDRLRAFC